MTTPQPDPWAKFDDLFVVEPVPDTGIGPLAFYGRVSTEDNQDPETSHDWQLRAATNLIEPFGGEIVADYFDIGLSRSLPWKRRPMAAQLLDDMLGARRTFEGIVVGEGVRCFYGSQFSEVEPLLKHHGINLYVPELSGRYEHGNATHYLMMTLSGGISRNERQTIQTRVRHGMAAQVEQQGRYQGGRPPYGYQAVAIGPHPNPRKASEGYKLKALAPDPEAAPVVQRIYAEYINGKSLRLIANGLNSDGIPCPSAHRPGQNRHRRQDGWQTSTISTILDNARYTGYEIWGRFKKVEELLDPGDVTLGNRTRLRRADQSAMVRSRKPAHEGLITVEDFVTAHQLGESRSGQSLTTKARQERTRNVPVAYALKGFIRCSICGRKLEAANRGKNLYFRCRSRGLVPGSETAGRHPHNLYVSNAALSASLHKWLAEEVFGPDHRETVLAVMVGAQDRPAMTNAVQARAEGRAKDARERMVRFQNAIAAGVDPLTVVEPINQAKADLDQAEKDLAALSERVTTDRHDVDSLNAILDRLGDLATGLFGSAHPPDLAEFYSAIGLSLVYDHEAGSLQSSITLPYSGFPLSVGGSARVRGGT